MAVCYRHPSRETGVSCSSCGRPICPDCMTPTPVGMRCPECSRDRTKVKTMRTAPSIADRHPGADRDQRHRVHRRDGGRRAAGGQRRAARSTATGRCTARRSSTSMSTGGSSPPGSCTTACSTSRVNMLSLYFVGRMLEPAIGSAQLRRHLLHLAARGVVRRAPVPAPDAFTVGASGAIFGVFGALIVVAHARGIPIWQSGLGAGPRAQPPVLGELQRHLDRGPPRRSGRRVDHGVARGRVRRTAPDAVGRLLGCLALAALSVFGALAVAGGHGLAPNGIGLTG